jgi:hypothetical protein
MIPSILRFARKKFEAGGLALVVVPGAVLATAGCAESYE